MSSTRYKMSFDDQDMLSTARFSIDFVELSNDRRVFSGEIPRRTVLQEIRSLYNLSHLSKSEACYHWRDPITAFTEALGLATASDLPRFKVSELVLNAANVLENGPSQLRRADSEILLPVNEAVLISLMPISSSSRRLCLAACGRVGFP